jgi:hypothetical protein
MGKIVSRVSTSAFKKTKKIRKCGRRAFGIVGYSPSRYIHTCRSGPVFKLEAGSLPTLAGYPSTARQLLGVGCGQHRTNELPYIVHHGWEAGFRESVFP